MLPCDEEPYEYGIEVSFDFFPAERPNFSYDNPHPPIEASVDIYSVKREGKEIKDELSPDDLTSLEQEAWKQIPGPDDGLEYDKYKENKL